MYKTYDNYLLGQIPIENGPHILNGAEDADIMDEEGPPGPTNTPNPENGGGNTPNPENGRGNTPEPENGEGSPQNSNNGEGSPQNS